MAQGRRGFLRHSALAVLGFPFVDHLLAAEIAGEPAKDLLALARERMKSEKKLGVVVVVPAKAEDARKLENDVAQLLGGHNTKCAQFPTKDNNHQPRLLEGVDPAIQALLCQAVFVCLPAAKAKEAFPDLPADAALVLLDLDGKPAATVAAHPDLFGKRFKEQLTALLHGKDGARLAAVIQAQRQALGKDLAARFDTAIRDLDSEQFAVRQAAAQLLAELAPRATGILATAYRPGLPLETTRRLDQLFTAMYNATPPNQPSARLPYGAQWVETRPNGCAGGFGEGAVEKCGRSSVPPESRIFLRFLTEKPK